MLGMRASRDMYWQPDLGMVEANDHRAARRRCCTSAAPPRRREVNGSLYRDRTWLTVTLVSQVFYLHARRGNVARTSPAAEQRRQQRIPGDPDRWCRSSIDFDRVQYR